MLILMSPDRSSLWPTVRSSPTSTQLKGRTMVKGRPYWSWAARAKYSTASFWKPYEDDGGAIRRSSPSRDGQKPVFSYTIEELRYVTFCSGPSPCTRIAASQAAAVIRSLVARRS